MIFHEIYGSYYNTVARILGQAVKGELTGETMQRLIRENAFEESILTIQPALLKQEWQLLTPALRTPLRHVPTMPLTLLQKRWMKAISLDARIRLFLAPEELEDFLPDVKPLFTPEDYVLFDRYLDGDPYQDAGYIQVFHTLLEALREGKALSVAYTGRNGKELRISGKPYRLEYSQKDDKFRVLLRAYRKYWTLNVAHIRACRLCGTDAAEPDLKRRPRPRYVQMELTDERNALERAMLHFADFEKEAERISDSRYRIRIAYERDDETELLIRVLAFGPLLRVTEPEAFVRQIRERLVKQKSCGLF